MGKRVTVPHQDHCSLRDSPPTQATGEVQVVGSHTGREVAAGVQALAGVCQHSLHSRGARETTRPVLAQATGHRRCGADRGARLHNGGAGAGAYTGRCASGEMGHALVGTRRAQMHQLPRRLTLPTQDTHQRGGHPLGTATGCQRHPCQPTPSPQSSRCLRQAFKSRHTHATSQSEVNTHTQLEGGSLTN